MIRNEDIDIMRREELQRMRVMKKNFAIFEYVCVLYMYACAICVCVCVLVGVCVCA